MEIFKWARFTTWNNALAQDFIDAPIICARRRFMSRVVCTTLMIGPLNRGMAVSHRTDEPVSHHRIHALRCDALSACEWLRQMRVFLSKRQQLHQEGRAWMRFFRPF